MPPRTLEAKVRPQSPSPTYVCLTYVFERPLEYGVRELVACPGSAGGQVAHVLEDGVCGGAGLARHLVLVQQLLQQRLLERLAAVAPQLLGAAPLRRVQRHLVHSPLQMFTMNTRA